MQRLVFEAENQEFRIESNLKKISVDRDIYRKKNGELLQQFATRPTEKKYQIHFLSFNFQCISSNKHSYKHLLNAGSF